MKFGKLIMIYYEPVYIVEIQKLKDAAKDIKKQNKHIKLNHTQILNFMIRILGFSSYSEYEETLNKNNRSNRWTSTLNEMNYHELEKLRSNFVKYFEKISINISDIYFIDNILRSKIYEMKRFDGFSIPVYLYTLPYILGRTDLKCVKIYDAQNINEQNVIKLLKIVSEKYEFPNNDILNVFKQINPDYENKNIFEIYEDLKLKPSKPFKDIENLSLFKDFGMREFFFALKNLYEDDNYKEGQLFEQLFKYYKGESTIEDVIYFIEMEIYESAIYLSHFYSEFDPEKSAGNTDINVPKFMTEGVRDNSTIKLISEINNIYTNDQPLILGKMKLNYLTNESKYLKISQTQTNENIFLLGCKGSGVSTVKLSIMAQLLKAGAGFIYINFENDESYEQCQSLKMYNIAKLFNRQKDIIDVSIYNKKEIARIDVNKLISKNKILSISCNSLDDVCIEERERIIGGFHSLISRIKNKSKTILPYSIFINNWYIKESENFQKIKNEMSRINKLKINFISSYTGFNVFRNDDIKKLFGNILILRTDDNSNLSGIDLNGLNLKDFKKENILPDGCFYFSRGGKIINKNSYYSFNFDVEIKESATCRINSNNI